MVVLTAMSASLYAAILIPFKVLPVIPGVTEFRRQFSTVPEGGSFTFDAEWVAASLHPRNCQFLVYAEFDGQRNKRVIIKVMGE